MLAEFCDGTCDVTGFCLPSVFLIRTPIPCDIGCSCLRSRFRVGARDVFKEGVAPQEFFLMCFWGIDFGLGGRWIGVDFGSHCVFA